MNKIPKITVVEYQNLIKNKNPSKFNYLWVDIFGIVHCTESISYTNLNKLPEFKWKLGCLGAGCDLVGKEASKDINYCKVQVNKINKELEWVFEND